MQEITRVVSAASRRLFAMRLAQGLAVGITAAVAIAGLVRLLEKVAVWQPQSAATWWTLGGSLAAAAVVGSFIYAAARSPRAVSVAQQVDDGAGLRDSLSTALAVSNAGDAWSRNVVDAAARAAVTVNVKTALPWQTPRHAWSPLIAAMCVLVLWFIPVPDVFGKRQVVAKQLEEQNKIEEARLQVKEAESKVLDPIKKLAPDLAKENPETKDAPQDVNKPKSAEDYRREGIKKLTNIQQKIEQMLGGVDAQKTQLSQDLLRQLRSPASGPMAAMSKEMAKGNFRAAQEELQKSLDQLASGNMSDSQKEQMKEQLQNLADQLQKLAENKKDMENKLQQQGMDPKLAGDPAKLAEALKNAEGMSEQQKDAMVTAAQAQAAAGEGMSAMAQAMQQMAQGMSQQGMDQQGAQAAQQAANMMQQMEGMMQDAKSMQAAMAEAKFQMQQMSQNGQPGQCNGMGACEGGLSGGNNGGSNPGSGQFKMGDTGNKGDGQGGPGQGDGGGRGEEAADEKWQQRKAKTQLGTGPIIASTFVEGDSIKNESKAKFNEVLEAASKDAQDAIETNAVDRRFQKAFKHFINSMQNNKGAPAAGAAAPADANPPEKK